jgi:FixJ family two-component response regulator
MTNKILFIDDDELALSLLPLVFKDEGYEIYTCSDPIEAIKLVLEIDFSVISTDLQMPKISGIDFLNTQEVVASKATKIIISGVSDLEAVIKAINSGVVWRYIQKPYLNEDIRIAVSNAVQFYEERQLKEKYFKEMMASKKELEELNENLTQMVQDRTRVIEDRSRLLKLLATTDDQTFIIEEAIKSIVAICGNLNFKIIKGTPSDLMFFPLMNDNNYLGCIIFDEINEDQLENITDALQGYAPIIEFCLTLLEAKANTVNILNDFSFLLNEDS